MLGANHIAEVLRANELDVAHIDHSLTYRENVANLQRQFGLQFTKPNYTKRYECQAGKAKAYNEANGALIDKMLANSTKAKKPVLIEPIEALQISSNPFDPIERAAMVEKIVMKGDARKYYRFRYSDFYNGIVTGDMVGCDLLCAYCWNFAKNANPATNDAFYSPIQVAQKLKAIARAKCCNQFRLSGAEPFLGLQSAKHIAEVIKATDGYFVIETNGLMIGHQPEILDLFSGLDVFWRVTIKGHNPDVFQRVTGAKGEFFQLPLQAIEEIQKRGLKLQVAFNPEIVSLRLPGCNIEHERMRSYPGVAKRMKERGIVTRAPAPSIIPRRSPQTKRRVVMVRSTSKSSHRPLKKEGDRWG